MTETWFQISARVPVTFEKGAVVKKFFAAVALAFALISSPTMAAKPPKMTPMELQSIQSREFETDKATAFGAVMSVIQDLGYIVESADLSSGFVTAASPAENKTSFFGALAGEVASGNTKMTAFLMQLPNSRTRVRLNFVNTKNSSSSYGRSSSQDKPILDANIYNNAWERIEEALFVIGALSDEPVNKSTNDATEPTPEPITNDTADQPT